MADWPDHMKQAFGRSGRWRTTLAVLGKIIGTSLGLVIGGPIGAVLGAVLGHHLDRRSGDPARNGQSPPKVRAIPTRAEQRQMAFAAAFAILLAKLCLADGHLSSDERRFLRKLGLSKAGEAGFLAVFEAAGDDRLGPEPYALQLVEIFGRSSAALERLLEALIFTAAADGVYHASERKFIQNIAVIFGISESRLEHLEALVTPTQTTRLSEAYDVLGVDPSVTDDELRKAYRKIVRANHPDFATAQGMPDDFVAVCNQVLAKSNAAYDLIRSERGIA